MNDSGWRKRQIALDKKAENARELGLDYEPSKTVLEMAREAWAEAGEGWVAKDWFDDRAKAFEAFEALVRADAIAEERDACAKLCDHMAVRYEDMRGAALESAAQSIRARGQA